jgi:energy-coupling factor transporter ATP-binding protein EcfA2
VPDRIEAEQLTKRYGPVTAVDHLTFTARPGHVTGFLGPSGAGKTTTVRILATLLAPDSGTARVLGHDVVNCGLLSRARRRPAKRGGPAGPVIGQDHPVLRTSFARLLRPLLCCHDDDPADPGRMVNATGMRAEPVILSPFHSSSDASHRSRGIGVLWSAYTRNPGR